MGTTSVLIVNYNGRDVVLAAIESVLAQTQPAGEIIVVDNGSSDGSVAAIRSSFPSVTVIELESNVGFAEGNNVALARASGEFIALLNSDAEAHRDWLRELTSVLESDDTIGAVVPKIRRHDRPDRIEQAGAFFNNIGHCWTRGFNEVDRGQFDDIVEVPALTACSTMVRRSALRGEPVFDRDFFMYYEELDLSLRLRANGYRILYVPRAEVRHRGMVSVQRATAEKELWQQFYCNRNRLKIVFRYFPARLIVRNLPLLALSVAWWDWLFLRRGGVRLFVRALRDQIVYALRGAASRRRDRARPWISWMTRQGLREMRATHATRIV